MLYKISTTTTTSTTTAAAEDDENGQLETVSIAKPLQNGQRAQNP